MLATTRTRMHAELFAHYKLGQGARKKRKTYSTGPAPPSTQALGHPLLPLPPPNLPCHHSPTSLLTHTQHHPVSPRLATSHLNSTTPPPPPDHNAPHPTTRSSRQNSVEMVANTLLPVWCSVVQDDDRVFTAQVFELLHLAQRVLLGRRRFALRGEHCHQRFAVVVLLDQVHGPALHHRYHLEVRSRVQPKSAGLINHGGPACFGISEMLTSLVPMPWPRIAGAGAVAVVVMAAAMAADGGGCGGSYGAAARRRGSRCGGG